jgi:carboxypeptidase family protein
VWGQSLKLCVVLLWSASGMLCQTQPGATAEPQEPGSIDGVVRSNATGQPLRRAQVILNPVGTRAGGRFQVTNEDGKFSFPKVAPGRYSISVERDGFLRLSAGRLGSYKMPPVFSVQPGETVGTLDFGMIPSGLISGRVKFDDAEPAAKVAVQLYREYYDRGRRGYQTAASGFTNDRGEYRLGGLEPGSYYVAALYRAPAHPASAEEEARTDQAGKPTKDLSYAVTFFPEVQKMAEAVAVGVQGGEEVGGIDIFLTQVHTVRVRGRVVSALSGQTIQTPSLAVRWNDPDNTASVSAVAEVSFDKDQNFEIKGLTAGPYWLIASGTDDGKTLMARTPLNVGDQDVDGINIAIGPESIWKGKIRVEGDDPPTFAGLVVSLEPRRATAQRVRADVSDNGEFAVAFWPNETYDLFVENADNEYLKEVHVATADRRVMGLQAELGDAPPPLDVVLSANGGQVLGRAVMNDSMVVASGAAIQLIPDPPDGRRQAYKSTYADEYGNFLLRGIAPGKYLLVAWLDQAPCDVHNPDDMPACRAHGVVVTVDESSGQSVQVTVN